MRLHLSIMRSAIYIFLAAIIFLVVSSYTLIHINRYVYFISSYVSNTQQEIAKKIIESKGAIPALLCKNQLYEQLCAIKFCSFSYQPDKTVCITIKNAKPVLCINNDKVITQNGCIQDRLLFDQNYVAQLPTVQARSLLSKRVIEWLIALPPTIFKNYNLEYNHTHSITLYPKNNCSYAFLVSGQQTLSEHFLQKCSDQLSHHTIGKKDTILYDLRFENYVIIYAQKGGADHG
jgi:hypothetical protein